MNNKLSSFLILSFVFASCSTVHIGVGGLYSSGRSGGCATRGGTSLSTEVSYFPKEKDGLGFALEMYALGYADCNDGDPLIMFSPQVDYRHFWKEKLAFNIGGGYATGVFIDAGLMIKGGVIYYPGKNFYLRFKQNLYRAFSGKRNAIMPGTSYDHATHIIVGIHF